MTPDLFSLQGKHPRPQSLSDPFHDNTSVSLRQLLSKPDDALRWGDFTILLGPHLPAGTYDEVAYFLPLAFNCIRANKGDALDLCSSLVWYCSEYANDLASDGVLDSARGELRDLLRDWTARFTIIHFDKSACVAKGWRLEYLDLVDMSETVCEMMCDLVGYARHADIVEQFVRDLIDFGTNPSAAAWLLELIRSREGVAYRPPLLPLLEETSVDHRILLTAYELSQTHGEIRDSSPTYWRDTLCQLGIAQI
jgi:hypothetical protein